MSFLRNKFFNILAISLTSATPTTVPQSIHRTNKSRLGEFLGSSSAVSKRGLSHFGHLEFKAMVRSFRLFVSRYVNIGAGRGFFNLVKAEKNFSATEKFNMEYDWMDKGVWLLKGFIIGAAMTAFMAFVLV